MEMRVVIAVAVLASGLLLALPRLSKLMPPTGAEVSEEEVSVGEATSPSGNLRSVAA